MITAIIIVGIVFYSVYAVRKIYRERKNGSCCGGCTSCSSKQYCDKQTKY